MKQCLFFNILSLLRKSSLLLFLSLAPFCDVYGQDFSYQRDTIYLWEDFNIHHKEEVTLSVFVPEKSNGISVIVCPGGSYYWLDKKGEGIEVGDWLAGNGITAFVLFYRTAGVNSFIWHQRTISRGKRHPDMITDAQRALQWVWENAEEYGIDRDKIGIMGFSAGGHLAMSAACFSETNFLEPYGICTNAVLRPAFVAPIYPVVTMNGPYAHKRSRRGLIGDIRQGKRIMRDSLSIENHIPDNCPPVFLINCADDPVVDYHNSVILDSALTCHHVPHEYIQYRQGKHGFGVSEIYGTVESRRWKEEFIHWLDGITWGQRDSL